MAMFRLAGHAEGEVHWNWGYAASVPAAALALVAAPGAGTPLAHTLAAVLVLLAIPWVVPAFVLAAVLSAPLYFWLRASGPAPEVMAWLGSTVLIGAVIGCHINGALLGTRLSRRRQPPLAGLGEFLRRSRNNSAH
jgi:hypothetical protein